MGHDSPPLVVVIPSRERPERLEPLAQAFRDTTPEHRMVFVVDPDDLPSQEAARCAGSLWVTNKRLTYPKKVNRGIEATTEPFILVGADDIRPHEGWFEAASALLDEEVGMVATNDLGNEYVMDGELATHPLIARWYFEMGTADGPGLYHEGYWHNGADLEASETARARGAFAYAADSVVEHLHPNYGKAEIDATYMQGGFHEAKRRYDEALIAKRRKLWTSVSASL